MICVLAFIEAGAAQQNARAIPDDLEIRLIHAGTIQFDDHYTYTIGADGRVSLEYQQHGRLPVNPSFEDRLKLERKLKPKDPAAEPRKRERISRGRLAEIVEAFRAAGFFEMRDRYDGNPVVPNAGCINHAATKGLAITANGRTKTVLFFLGCGYGDMPEYRRFNELLAMLSREIADVKVTEAEAKSEEN